ncbi:hypothetical protein BH20CHL7_BH20CHL7_07510 [soil metagenome]
MTSILEPLVAAATTLTHRLDERFVELGFRTTEYLTLWSVLTRPEDSAAEIRRRLRMRDAAFSEVVERALARGYLRVGPAASDRRTRMLALTLPGRTATQIARSIHGQVEAEVVTGQDLLTLYTTLVRLDRSLQVIEPPERLGDGLPVTTI